MSDNTTQTKRSKRLWIVVLLLSLLLLLLGFPQV